MKLLTAFKKEFDRSISQYLQDKRHQVEVLDKHGGEMVQSIQTFLDYGGKRFRPALFHFAYQSFAEKKKFDSLRFSLIFELFHTFALIHDDIIDHADVRRGNPTIHTKYGLHMGVLAGDFALTLADEIYTQLVVSASFTQKEITAVNAYFNAYKQELLVGQYLDCIHLDDRTKIMQLKTADYSFVKPVVFALLLCNQENQMVQQWKLFLTRLGILFQMKDDYEGVFMDESHTGKSMVSDTAEGKNTYIVALFKKSATKQELAHFRSFFGKEALSPVDFAWYQRILKEKGVEKQVRLEITHECLELAHQLDTQLGSSTLLHQLIHELIIYISQF